MATTPDGIVEAVEARFASPFWLGVQWHPESTVELDDGVSRAIFATFVDAAAQNAAARPDGFAHAERETLRASAEHRG